MAGAIILYLQQQGYGFTPSASLSQATAAGLFVWTIGIGGILGLVCTFLAIYQLILNQKIWIAILGTVALLPLLILSVFYVYAVLFVEAAL